MTHRSRFPLDEDFLVHFSNSYGDKITWVARFNGRYVSINTTHGIVQFDSEKWKFCRWARLGELDF